MICEKCGNVMQKNGKFFFCGECGNSSRDEEAAASTANCIYKGDLRFQDADSINEMKERIFNNYPLFIKHLMDGAFNGKSALEKNNYCNKAFFWTTRYFAFISLCCYLNDDEMTKDNGVEDSLSGLSLAYDSSWNTIISSVVSCYRKKDMLFPIPEFIVIMEKLLSPEKGYKNGIYGKQFNDLYEKNMSLLNAAKELRNLLAHATDKVVTEEVARFVLPYYMDIVLSIFMAADSFLNGERFLLVEHIAGREFKKLQADGSRIVVDVPEEKILKIFEESSVGLIDLKTNSMYVLFPFLYRILEMENEEELYFDTKISSRVAYVGWKNSSVLKEKKGYDKLISLVAKKGISFKKMPMSKMNGKYIIDYSNEKTTSTYNRDYKDKKYYTDCYVKLDWLEKMFGEFMEGRETAFFVTGEAGLGKSAFLADLAVRYLEREDSGVVPIFLNASEIRKLDSTVNPIAWLMREYFLIENSDASSLAKIAEGFHTVFQKSNMEKDVKLLLIIDAVNEYYSPVELFEEIDSFISDVYSSAQYNSPKYPWLKVVYSMRQTGYEQIIYHKKANREFEERDFSIFYKEFAYYRIIDSSTQNEKELKMTPVIRLKPLGEAEIEEVFIRHMARGKLTSAKFELSAVKGKEKILGNPLNIMIFIELALKNGLESLKENFNEKTLLQAYFESFSGDIKEFLLKITEIMLDKELKPSISNDETKEICKAFSDEAAINNNIYYKDPQEKLISLGILKSMRIEADYDIKLYIGFVSQKYCEESIRLYLKKKYNTEDKDFVGKLLNTDTDFEEYNNVVAEFLYELYDNKRIDAMLVPEIVNQERYYRAFRKAFVKDLELCSANRFDVQAQEEIARKYSERLQLLIGSREKIAYVQGLENIFTEYVIPSYRNRYCAGMVLKDLANSFKEMYLLLGLKSRNYAKLLNFIGDVEFHRNLNEARETYCESQKIIEGLSAQNPGDATLKRDASISYDRIGDMDKAANNMSKARELYEKSLKIREELSAKNPKDTNLKRDVSISYDNIGDLEKAANNVTKARELYENSLKIRVVISLQNPGDANLKRDVSISYNKIGDLEKAANNLSKARELYEKSQNIREELSAQNPEDANMKRDLSVSYERIGELEKAESNIKMAIELYEKSLKIAEELSAQNPGDANLKRDLSVSYERIGDLEKVANNVTKARELYEKSLKIRGELSDQNPDDANMKRDVSISYNKIGDLERAANNVTKARELYEKSLKIRGELSDQNPDGANMKRDVSISYKRK